MGVTQIKGPIINHFQPLISYTNGLFQQELLECYSAHANGLYIDKNCKKQMVRPYQDQEILIDHTPIKFKLQPIRTAQSNLIMRQRPLFTKREQSSLPPINTQCLFVKMMRPFEISTTENHSQVTFSEKLTDALKTQKIQHQKIIFESSKHLDSAHPEDMIITSHTSAALFSTILKNLTITWPTGHIDSSKLANLAHILKMAQAYPDTIWLIFKISQTSLDTCCKTKNEALFADQTHPLITNLNLDIPPNTQLILNLAHWHMSKIWPASLRKWQTDILFYN